MVRDTGKLNGSRDGRLSVAHRQEAGVAEEQAPTVRSTLRQRIFVVALLILGFAVSCFVILRVDPRAVRPRGALQHEVHAPFDAGARRP